MNTTNPDLEAGKVHNHLPTRPAHGSIRKRMSLRILDPSGERARPVDGLESSSRKRRKDKYAGMTDAEIEERRSQRRSTRRGQRDSGNIKSGSGGSDEKRHRSRRRDPAEDYDAYADPVMKTFDGRPTIARNESKRKSFLGGFF